MKYTCAFCGRGMDTPAVYIGSMAVGPTCARKAGLFDLSRKRSGLVFPAVKRSKPAKNETLDLFSDQ